MHVCICVSVLYWYPQTPPLHTVPSKSTDIHTFKCSHITTWNSNFSEYCLCSVTFKHIIEHILAFFQIPEHKLDSRQISRWWETTGLTPNLSMVNNKSLSPHNNDIYTAKCFTYIFPTPWKHGFSTNVTLLFPFSCSYDNHLSHKTGPHNCISYCSLQNAQENKALGWVMIIFHRSTHVKHRQICPSMCPVCT